MSYPGAPGVASSTPRPHPSLPARPPPSTASPGPASRPPNNGTGASKAAFTAFAPRQVAAANTFRTNSPAHYSAAPTTSYSSGPQYSQPQPDYQAQPQYGDSSYMQAPQIRNPFIPTPPTGNVSSTFAPPPNYDPEYEAQIQQWQSAYVTKDDKGGKPIISSATRTETASPANLSSKAGGTDNAAAAKTVRRSGGGTTWTDSTLLEWDPAHFRIFVGNLAGEVTDDSLLKAFSKYPSVQKARVIRDKRTTKSKGYGFVSFSDGDDYFRAAREMQGKYIGSHPVLLKRATTEVKPAVVQGSSKGRYGKNSGKGGGGGGYGAAGGKTEFGGVQKKPPKTKGGLKVLG